MTLKAATLYETVSFNENLRLVILIKGDCAFSQELLTLINAHGPILGDVLNLFNVFNDDLELIIAFTKLEESKEYNTLQRGKFIEDAEDVENTIMRNYQHIYPYELTFTERGYSESSTRLQYARAFLFKSSYVLASFAAFFSVTLRRGRINRISLWNVKAEVLWEIGRERISDLIVSRYSRIPLNSLRSACCYIFFSKSSNAGEVSTSTDSRMCSVRKPTISPIYSVSVCDDTKCILELLFNNI